MAESNGPKVFDTRGNFFFTGKGWISWPHVVMFTIYNSGEGYEHDEEYGIEVTISVESPDEHRSNTILIELSATKDDAETALEALMLMFTVNILK